MDLITPGSMTGIYPQLLFLAGRRRSQMLNIFQNKINRKGRMIMARHCFNLSKHKIDEKINLLRLIEVLVQDYCDMPDAKVYMPMTEKWDGVIEIPDLTLDQIAQRIMRYYNIKPEELAKAREKLGLPDERPYDEVPIASSSKTDYAIRPWE